MIRPYFVAIAASAFLVLNAGVADAAKPRKAGTTHAQKARSHLIRTAQAEHPAGTHAQSGIASYYGKAHHGKRTASGVRFDQNAMTAAHPTLPFGTRVKVTHVGSNRSIVVTINDRLPSRRRIIDLSYGAAQQLGMIRQGIAQVVLTPV